MRATRVLTSLTPHVMWVSSTARVLPPDLTIRQVADLPKVGGALGGLGGAMTEASRAWVWIIACDLPYIEPEHLTPLIEVARTASAEVKCVVSRDHMGRPQPLCGLWRSGEHHALQLLSQLTIHKSTPSASSIPSSSTPKRSSLSAYVERCGLSIELELNTATRVCAKSINKNGEIQRGQRGSTEIQYSDHPLFNLNTPADLKQLRALDVGER